jgi:hypothetical protein
MLPRMYDDGCVACRLTLTPVYRACGKAQVLPPAVKIKQSPFFPCSKNGIATGFYRNFILLLKNYIDMKKFYYILEYL